MTGSAAAAGAAGRLAAGGGLVLEDARARRPAAPASARATAPPATRAPASASAAGRRTCSRVSACAGYARTRTAAADAPDTRRSRTPDAIGVDGSAQQRVRHSGSRTWMRPRGVQHGAVRPSVRTGRRAGVHARRGDGLVDMDANAPAGQAYKEAKERSRRPDDKKKVC